MTQIPHEVSAAAHVPFQGPNPVDKARAAELYESVKGTDLEERFRQISGQHKGKYESAEEYRAFLNDIEALFVVPEVLPPPQAAQPEVLPPSGHTEETQSTAEEPLIAVSAVQRDIQGGLFQHLAAMLTDGHSLTFKVLAVQDRLVVGIFPEAAGSGDTPVPFTLSESPAWFDEHLPSALTPYTHARQDAAEIARGIAQKQREANAQAKAKPAAPATSTRASKPAETKAKKSFTVTLKASEGTTISAKCGTTPLDLKLGDNELDKAQMLTITTTHDVYGTHSKTYNLSGAKVIDLDEQQGTLLTVKTVPEDAAVEVTNGSLTLALHGSRRLPEGKWTVTAEADGHQTRSATVTLKVPSDGQTVELALEPSLF